MARGFVHHSANQFVGITCDTTASRTVVPQGEEARLLISHPRDVRR